MGGQLEGDYHLHPRTHNGDRVQVRLTREKRRCVRDVTG
jgi:hypothetical protein